MKCPAPFPFLSKRSGFTLIEVCLCLVVLVLLSAVVWLSLRGAIDRVRLSQLCQRVASEDARERSKCSENRQYGGCLYDSSKRQIVYLRSNRVIPIPIGVNVRWIVANGLDDVASDSERSNQRRTEKQAVRFSDRGRSASYAIQVSLDSKSNDDTTHWIVVLGATGQTIECADADEMLFLLQGGV
jgi:prepilin-type N-terminal cleavage/methylation domain-containing protein